MARQTIDLDCPPGPCRPGDLIRGVIQDTGVQPVTFDVTPFFGAATYEFEVDRETWVTTVQPIIRPRIEALYHNGTIRYGSW